MSEWQPIETAPRDGSWVLLTGGHISSGWYGWVGTNKPPMVVALFDERWGRFIWYDDGHPGEYEDPTHWMPLPEPPA